MLVGTRKESERMGEEWLILILKYSLRIALTIIYFMYAEKIEKIASGLNNTHQEQIITKKLFLIALSK